MRRTPLLPVGRVAPAMVHRYAMRKPNRKRTSRVTLNLTVEDRAFLDALIQTHNTTASSIVSDLFAEWCRCIRSGRDASGQKIDWNLSEPLPQKVQALIAKAREIIREKI